MSTYKEFTLIRPPLLCKVSCKNFIRPPLLCKVSCKGFTLIELLVSVAIIAILASIGLLVYRSSIVTGNDTKRIRDVQEIQKALEGFYQTNNRYPTVTEFNSVSSNPVKGSFQNNIIPCDPSSSCAQPGGAGYNYTPCDSSGTPQSYNLCSQLTTCGSRCTSSASPNPSTNTCISSRIGAAGSGSTYFCVMVSN